MNCSAAQMRAQTLGSGRVRDQLLRKICRDRGEFYLGEARRYVQRGDLRNALAAVNEGLRSSSGPFYLVVRDELEVLHTQLA